MKMEKFHLYFAILETHAKPGDCLCTDVAAKYFSEFIDFLFLQLEAFLISKPFLLFLLLHNQASLTIFRPHKLI